MKKLFSNINMATIVGLAATAISFGATLLSGWADEKKLDEKVKEQVKIELNNR